MTKPAPSPAPAGSTDHEAIRASLIARYPRIPTPDGHYTAPEVAKRYGVSKNAIIGQMGGENWLQRGLKVSPITPRDPRTGEVLRYYFREADVEDFVARMHAEGRWKWRGPGSADDPAA